MTEHKLQQDPWAALVDELDAWSTEGKVADLWWRDDDATSPGPKLDRLFELTTNTGLLLATIPAPAVPELRPVIEQAPHVRVGQHGYAHINHAPKGKGLGAWELGLHRGEAAVLDDLDCGRDILEQLFGELFVAVVIPPWNRLDAALVRPIADRGYLGISRFGARNQKHVTESCVVVNSHCDPINWKSGPQFTGESKALDQLISHLESRRTGEVDAAEPTGVLTHHVVLDEAGWDFCTRLVEVLDSHPAASWSSIPQLFPEGS
ncbi:MAG: polysaccharide deacetylase family protein [Granulosicoccus sp.]|nr:polysaccharide deacetylase family protein [Granulosicoccus sp.]